MKYNDIPDDEYFEYYDILFEPLTRWFYDRTFDSGLLIGGPTIGFFRFENRGAMNNM